MASTLKNLSDYDENKVPSGADMKIGIVVSEWNSEITHALFEGCYDTLIKHGVNKDNIEIAHVPGSFELTAGARILAQSKSVDAVICIGCVIKGETSHNEYINMAVAQGLTNLSIASGKPFIFGLLTPNNMEQAKDRAGGKHGNKGVEAAITALRMADLKKSHSGTKSKIGF
ncbi:MAG: 6,7-dimethyl-8-ribityllumazine synthase [Bacteroidota bacterium]